MSPSSEESKCTRCKFHAQAKTNCMAGRGSTKPPIDLMIIGEGPFFEEDKRGVPFVGRAGRDLEKAITEFREAEYKIYLTNATRCSKGTLGSPTTIEIRACKPYLDLEIKLLKPKHILCLGSPALYSLTGKQSITAYRGKILKHPSGAIIVPTWHPSAVARDRILKFPQFNADLDLLLSVMNGTYVAPKGVKEYKEIKTPEELERLKREILATGYVSLDVENDAPWRKPQSEDEEEKEERQFYPLITISFSMKADTAFCLLLPHHPDCKLPEKEITKFMIDIFTNPNLLKIHHNGARSDIPWIKQQYGIKIPGPHFDTMLAYYVSVNEEMGRISLDRLSYDYTNMGGYKKKLLDPYLQKGMRTLLDMETEDLITYNSSDADATIQVYFNLLKGQVEKTETFELMQRLCGTQKALKRLYELGAPVDYEKTIVLEKYLVGNPKTRNGGVLKETLDQIMQFPEIAKAEKMASKIETKKRREAYQKRWEEYQNKIIEYEQNPPLNRNGKRKASPRPPEEPEKVIISFDPRISNKKKISDAHKRILFFKVMQYEPLTYTKQTNEPSADKEFLEAHMYDHPIFAAMRKMDKINKLYSTYVENIKAACEKYGDRVCIKYDPIAVTGRIRSDMQNAPRRGSEVTREDKEEATHIRQLFCVPKDPWKFLEIPKQYDDEFFLLEGDFSQLELRIAASYSEESYLIDAFNKGEDIHSGTAEMVFEKKQKDLSEETWKVYRSDAKTINFGIWYGISEIGLSKQMGKSVEETEEILKKYHSKMPNIKKYSRAQADWARREGFIRSGFNRIRHLGQIYSTNRRDVESAERKATNNNVQADAADLMTLITLPVMDEYLEDNGFVSRIVMTVHDSIIFLCPKRELKTVAVLLKSIMEDPPNCPLKLKVPLIADLKVGKNWAHMEDYEVDWRRYMT